MKAQKWNLTIIFIAILFLVIPTSGSLVNGIFYYNNITPQNSPFELRVNPGDTLYLGRAYDLSYVDGVSKSFAWWSDWKTQATDCEPDKIVTVGYIETNGTIDPRAVYLDPTVFKPGMWWQWDGCFEQYNYKTGESSWVPYPNDNNLAFIIVNMPERPAKTPNISVNNSIRGDGAIKTIPNSSIRGGIPEKVSVDIVKPTIQSTARGDNVISSEITTATPKVNITMISTQKENATWPWWYYLIMILVAIGVIIWLFG
jgi:hypothetical protein